MKRSRRGRFKQEGIGAQLGTIRPEDETQVTHTSSIMTGRRRSNTAKAARDKFPNRLTRLLQGSSHLPPVHEDFEAAKPKVTVSPTMISPRRGADTDLNCVSPSASFHPRDLKHKITINEKQSNDV